jgi:hypothetical protein
MKGIEIHLDYMDKLGVDGANAPCWFRADAGLSPFWLSRVKMPGRELPEDSMWQVEETEDMTVEDYDTIINQGFDAFLAKFLPKVIDMKVFEEGLARMQEVTPVMFEKYFERGYVLVTSGTTSTPFDTLCGGRSMVPFFMDLYRIPEKVKEVMEVMTQMFIDRGIQTADQTGIRCVWVGGWRCASALLAPKLWDEFVFPYFHKITYALAEKDVMSVLHLDQDWTRDLARLRELPEKKCILNTDGMTDVRKAREILGDHMAIMGDVPPDLLATGSPDTVYDYVRDLIRDIGRKGLLLTPGCDAPINARDENMTAMFEAGREYGRVG